MPREGRFLIIRQKIGRWIRWLWRIGSDLVNASSFRYLCGDQSPAAEAMGNGSKHGDVDDDQPPKFNWKLSQRRRKKEEGRRKKKKKKKRTCCVCDENV
jgi:sRNA-binding protein